jgi:hypothetical protein
MKIKIFLINKMYFSNLIEHFEVYLNIKLVLIGP